MYANTNEETYTLSEAKRILREEETRRKEAIIAKVTQIALGILCLLLCALVPKILDGDCTIWFVLIPMSLGCFFGFGEEGK